MSRLCLRPRYFQGLSVFIAHHKIGITRPLKDNGSGVGPCIRLRPQSLGRSSIMVDSERSKPESCLTLLWLSMVAIAVVTLFVWAAALIATIEFVLPSPDCSAYDVAA
jgi:hypothetical protein